MKSFLAGCLLFFYSLQSFSQSAAATWSVKFSDAIISRYQPTINTMTGKGWEYSNSIILHGIEKVYARVQNAGYLNYIKAYVDAYVNSSGAISGLAQNLDKIHPGILCLFLYEKTGQVKYKTAATNLRNYLLSGTYPKTPDGGYWHKNNSSYKNVMMADGMYMAYPFLVKYGKMFNDPACFDVATTQILLLSSHIYDNSTNLLKHAWNYDKTTFAWSDPVTGVSREVWSRGMGWFVMALTDVLRFLPSTHSKYNQVKSLLVNLAVGIKNTQNATTGLWYQVVNKGTSSGNYLETSGSAMFVYAIKVAVDSGWISSSYLTVAQNGWTGLKTKIATYTDGKPQIKQFAPAMGVQNNYSAYVAISPVNCPTSGTLHPHGYAAILMAASVMEFPLSSARVTVSQANTVIENKLLLWSVYPNPVHDQLSISYQSGNEQKTTLELYDMAGHLLLSKQIQLMKGSNRLEWDINAIPAGIYFIGIKELKLSRTRIIKE
jgi:unsaturated rhamnogalacturonyl hydrolase